jgi:hypothetical protein
VGNPIRGAQRLAESKQEMMGHEIQECKKKSRQDRFGLGGFI